MTLNERKRLGKYVRNIANTLGLRDWQLNLMPDEPDTKEAHAAVACTYGRKIASIWFASGFELLEPQEQRHVIVHELLHIHFDRVLTLSSQALPAAMGAPAWGVFDEAMRDHIEHGVDAVAEAIADAFPLPE